MGFRSQASCLWVPASYSLLSPPPPQPPTSAASETRLKDPFKKQQENKVKLEPKCHLQKSNRT